MAYNKQQSAIIEFAENVPKTITLKTEPSIARGKEYISKANKPYTKWTYFTANGEVFFAFSNLHQELQRFRTGDTITITYTVPAGQKYGIYKIDGVDGSAVPVTTDLQTLARENNNLIRMLIQRIDALLPNREKNPVTPVEETPREKSDTDLGF